jgi:uncharacterized protein YehS (DUF1456 family)
VFDVRDVLRSVRHLLWLDPFTFVPALPKTVAMEITAERPKKHRRHSDESTFTLNRIKNFRVSYFFHSSGFIFLVV